MPLRLLHAVAQAVTQVTVGRAAAAAWYGSCDGGGGGGGGGSGSGCDRPAAAGEESYEDVVRAAVAMGLVRDATSYTVSATTGTCPV